MNTLFTKQRKYQHWSSLQSTEEHRILSVRSKFKQISLIKIPFYFGRREPFFLEYSDPWTEPSNILRKDIPKLVTKSAKSEILCISSLLQHLERSSSCSETIRKNKITILNPEYQQHLQVRATCLMDTTEGINSGLRISFTFTHISLLLT